MTWVEIMRDEHQMLRAQAQDLESVLAMPSVDPTQRWGAMAWLVRQLAPSLTAHLQREGTVLLPELERLLGRQAGALAVVKAEHEELRTVLARLQACVAMTGPALPAEERQQLGSLLVELLDDHEVKVERLVMDVLAFSLTQGAQNALAEALAARGAPGRRLGAVEPSPLLAREVA